MRFLLEELSKLPVVVRLLFMSQLRTRSQKGSSNKRLVTLQMQFNCGYTSFCIIETVYHMYSYTLKLTLQRDYLSLFAFHTRFLALLSRFCTSIPSQANNNYIRTNQIPLDRHVNEKSI